MNSFKEQYLPYIRGDISAALVVFLVALPLCLGIALASGAPLLAGIIAGVVGAVVIAPLSGSQLSVSGPAAGLTVIILTAIQTLGSFEALLAAVVIAGILQLIFGFLKAGIIGYYFPSSVIKGMLAAIGVILILKQIPHALGYDVVAMGDEAFDQIDKHNTFTELVYAVRYSSPGAIVISLGALGLMLFWELKALKRFALFRLVPAALVAVIFGAALNSYFIQQAPDWAMGASHRVNLPTLLGASAGEIFTLPDFSILQNYQGWIVAVTIAIVASLETLLSVEAADKIDPWKRNTPTNRELKAQGVGNIVSGMIGGLPMTAVIVRSSANVNAGGRTKLSAILHGIYLMAFVLLIPSFLNQIPLAVLAVVLIVVGYKLAKVQLFKSMFKLGWDQFLPFIATIIAVVLTDLLKGIAIGLFFAAFFILRNNFRNAYFAKKSEGTDGHHFTITLAEEVSFLNKGSILQMLTEIPDNSSVLIDGSQSAYIDYDILELVSDFVETAARRNITVEIRGIKNVATSSH
jgi:MFS superfamily sulfate permease-like transporter